MLYEQLLQLFFDLRSIHSAYLQVAIGTALSGFLLVFCSNCCANMLLHWMAWSKVTETICSFSSANIHPTAWNPQSAWNSCATALVSSDISSSENRLRSRYTYYQHWASLGVGREMYQSKGGCPGPISNISSVVNPGNGDQQKQTPGGENSNCILTVEYLLTIWSSGLITNCSRWCQQCTLYYQTTIWCDVGWSRCNLPRIIKYSGWLRGILGSTPSYIHQYKLDMLFLFLNYTLYIYIYIHTP